MKNNLLATVLIIYNSLAIAQNVNIPDPNFKAYLIGNSFINLNGDTEIQISEATAFNGGINLYGMNIYDLTGIEAFTALTHLDCSANELSSIDLTFNSALTYLYCYGNQLTSLNVNGALALTHLDCHLNQLTNLELSQNIELIDLYCGQNQLTNLDVSQNTALIELSCVNNQLTNLDLSSAVALIWLVCNNNSLSSLNLRNGNNNNIINFHTANNPSLFCIEVDDTTYSIANWQNIDPWSSFSTNCSANVTQETKESYPYSIYPNPTINTINLEADERLIGSIYSIYDTMGKLILNGKITSENTTIDLSEISQGIYSLRVGLNLEQTVKVVKE